MKALTNCKTLCGRRWVLMGFLVAAASLTAGCFSAHKKTESLHSVEKFNPESGKLVSREIFRDRSKGGGAALLADPKASQINSVFTNQVKLGGGSTLSVGQIESVVSTNAAQIIESGGSAVGNVINSAINGGK